MNDEKATAAVGHNIPPTDADPLLGRLQEDHAKLMTRRDELLVGIARAPKIVEDDIVSGQMGDFSDQIFKCIKHAKAMHHDEKEPFLTAGRTVDAFMHSIVDVLEKGRADIDERDKAYLDRKAAIERQRRKEVERKAREEAAAAQKTADEAAAKQRDETARTQKLADEAATKLREEDDLEKAIEAEAEVARLAALADEETKKADDEAKRLALIAEKAKKDADAKPAELSRTRGEYGSVKSLKHFWDHVDLDRSTIDLEALRQHIPTDALDKAVRSWINANKDELRAGKQLAGVRIFENTRL